MTHRTASHRVTPSGPHWAWAKGQGPAAGQLCPRFRSALIVLRSSLFLSSVLLLLLALPATADSLRLSGSWINNVTVRDIVNGEIVFLNAGGTVVKTPVTELDGIRMDSYPELAQGEGMVTRKASAEAYKAFAALAKKGVKEPWLKVWIDFRLLTLADKLNQPVDSTEAFLRIAEANGPTVFLSKGPDQSLAALQAAGKKALLGKIDVLAPKVPAGPNADALKKLREAIDAIAAPDAGAAAPGTPGTPGAPTPGTPASGIPDTPPSAAGGPASFGASVVPFPKALPADDPVTKLIVKGQFEDAVKEADKIMETEAGLLAMRLYQKGLAQLNIAIKADDPKSGTPGITGASPQDPKVKQVQNLYLDAGLSLARVVVYPNLSRSAYAGASCLEAGFVHFKIGRYDLARKLYDRAGLYIDEREDPKLTMRREQLVKELNAVYTPEPEPEPTKVMPVSNPPKATSTPPKSTPAATPPKPAPPKATPPKPVPAKPAPAKPAK
jgi:tetratricopeptide (TPR) repeat protein